MENQLSEQVAFVRGKVEDTIPQTPEELPSTRSERGNHNLS